LVSQMRKAATSIPTNLMEGAYRMSRKEFRHFISIAKGSCGEIRYQLLLAKDLQYLREEKYTELESSYERISMMLTKLYKSL
jgi:four helix bundle protein